MLLKFLLQGHELEVLAFMSALSRLFLMFRAGFRR
jgi:hypothetical protein